jgi:hypothetical protein
MRNVEEIDYAVVERHLTNEFTGVPLPCKANQCTCYRVLLDADDASNIVLYHDFEEYTADKSCRLADLLPSVAELPRVKNFLKGEPTQRYRPTDLRTLTNREPTVLVDDLDGTFLYMIDGNNRTIAQQLAGKGFQGVPAFVIVWPKLMKWIRVPKYHKARRK